jgi:hypothetical protein
MTETHMLLVVIHIDALLEERSLAVMLGMLFSKMQVDVAVTMDKPDLQQEEELSAHLFRNVEVWQGVCIALSQSSQSIKWSFERSRRYDSSQAF